MKQLANLSTIHATLIIDELIKQDISDFYISPGKRNLPLINALLSSSKYDTLNIQTFVDERTTAFTALGSAHTTRHPVVIISTSGSALSHFYGAILEAKKSNIPIIILSADRPNYLVTSNANQSINQINFFQLSENRFLSLDIFSAQNDPARTKSQVAYISNLAKELSQPVHINIAFAEPLDHTEEPLPASLLTITRKLLKATSPYTTYKTFNHFDASEYDVCVIGPWNNPSPLKGIKTLIKNFRGKLFVDITSSEDKSYNNFHPDQKVFKAIISQKKSKLLHIGGRITSNQYYRLLKDKKITITQITSNNQLLEDPAAVVTEKIATNKIIYTHKQNKKRNTRVKFPTFNHLSIADTLWHDISPEVPLFLSNSMVIRAFDIIPKKISRSNTFTQRGVSGIDGNLAHALGIALKTGEVNIAIGDIAFLHDLSTLPAFSSNNLSVNIFIFNNQQGGIFNLLKLHESTLAQQLIATPHSQNFTQLAKQFDANYYLIDNLPLLRKTIVQLPKEQINIVELKIEQSKSEKAFKQIL